MVEQWALVSQWMPHAHPWHSIPHVGDISLSAETDPTSCCSLLAIVTSHMLHLDALTGFL